MAFMLCMMTVHIFFKSNIPEYLRSPVYIIEAISFVIFVTTISKSIQKKADPKNRVWEFIFYLPEYLAAVYAIYVPVCHLLCKKGNGLPFICYALLFLQIGLIAGTYIMRGLLIALYKKNENERRLLQKEVNQGYIGQRQT